MIVALPTAGNPASWRGIFGLMDRDLKQMQDPLGLLRLGYADSLLPIAARHWHDGAFEERTEQVVEETPVDIVKYSQGIELQAAVAADCEAVIATRTRRLTGRTGCGICGSDSIEGVLKTLHAVPAG